MSTGTARPRRIAVRAISPTKNGAMTSCSSSTRSSTRNCVCSLPPPSTISRLTPRHDEVVDDIRHRHAARPSPTTVAAVAEAARHATQRCPAGSRRSSRHRPRRRTTTAAADRRSPSPSPSAGEHGRPVARRSEPPLVAAHQQSRIVTADRRRADHDRVALGAQLVDPIEVGGDSTSRAAGARRCRGIRRATSRS